MDRPLTYQEAVLKQAVTDLNNDGKRPMYGEITKKVQGQIRETPYNKVRLATLVKDGFLGLQGKRYYDPELIGQEEQPNEVLITDIELLADAETNDLTFFILNLRAYQPTSLIPILKDFIKYGGLNEQTLRRIQITIILLQMLMRDYKSIPVISVDRDLNMDGGDATKILLKLMEAWDK